MHGIFFAFIIYMRNRGYGGTKFCTWLNPPIHQASTQPALHLTTSDTTLLFRIWNIMGYSVECKSLYTLLVLGEGGSKKRM